MKKKIQFLSASDRLNYGDLLFPIITKTVLSSETDIDFNTYGLIQSDLSDFGAFPTKGYRNLENENTENSFVIVGGGHVLFPDWGTLYGHLNSLYLRSKKFKICNWLYQWLQFPRVLFTSSKTVSPFAPNHLQGVLVYLSVGGNLNAFRHNKNIDAMLRNCGLLSVRDNMLYEQLLKEGIPVFKVPDSAVIISKLFPEHTLSQKVSDKFNFDITQKYIIVQIGLHKGPEDQKRFVSAINILEKKGYRVLAMPIGLAPDHEDDKVLGTLLSQDPSWLYYRPENIYEIMYLICNASWFFGTSLHGCITAFAYNTAFVPLNKKVKKLNNYTKTWWASFIQESIAYDDLENYIREASEDWNSIEASRQLQLQQSYVIDNYDRLLAIIKNNSE